LSSLQPRRVCFCHGAATWRSAAAVGDRRRFANLPALSALR
jgi:hypothetical protein